ncbi:MAG TPA: hypothetical protein VGR57_14710 [Ktedonobacterales bacterium]|nr:hypothetical protein [Ktedonobacterales bacterium]
MILFLTQAPVLCALLPALIAIALLEAVGLRVRYNIFILSLVALALICANFLRFTGQPDLPQPGVPQPGLSIVPSLLPSLLPALGVTLALVVYLYTLATARRGKQWRWFTGLLVAGVVTLGGIVAGLAALPAVYGPPLLASDIALAFVPPLSTLAYATFAPDFPRAGGRMRR